MESVIYLQLFIFTFTPFQVSFVCQKIMPKDNISEIFKLPLSLRGSIETKETIYFISIGDDKTLRGWTIESLNDIVIDKYEVEPLTVACSNDNRIAVMGYNRELNKIVVYLYQLLSSYETIMREEELYIDVKSRDINYNITFLYTAACENDLTISLDDQIFFYKKIFKWNCIYTLKTDNPIINMDSYINLLIVTEGQEIYCYSKYSHLLNLVDFSDLCYPLINYWTQILKEIQTHFHSFIHIY